jgi:nicotinate-nucleotide adenylyltransferase
LVALRDEYPEWEFFYIIGADTLEELHTWYKFAEVVKLTNFLVVDREAGNNLNIIDIMDYYRNNFNASIINTSYKGLNISSTEIRKRIKENKSISEMVDEAVEEYIYSNELYK